MFRRKNKKKGTDLTTENTKKTNAWKRYGAIAMAGVLLVGAGTAAEVAQHMKVVNAKEKKEVTLNLAEELAEEETAPAEEETAEPEEETEAAEEQTAEEEQKETLSLITADEDAEQKETFADIEKVQSSENAIVTTDVSEVVENCMPSIVSINNISVQEVETYYYGTQTYEAESAASGIIVAQNDEELLIATNSHVVDDAEEISVCFTAEAEDVEDLVAPAKIKGMDRNYELAVVAVQLSDIPEEVRDQLKIATIGKSSDLKVGQAAIAIGNALGYGQSVTSGIISALNRELTIDDFSQEVIMTDAAINFGNSGGALLNAKGEVIGINVAKEAGDGVDSMGYSIPIDTAVPILQRLINKETRDQMDNSERGYMGITVVNVSDDAKELYDMPEGAFVYEVSEDSAAAEAGIKKGDIITMFDGETVASSDDLIDKMCYYAVGETVTIEVQTANSGEYEAREVEVTLQKGSEEAAAAEEEEQQTEAMNDQEDSEDYLPFQDGFEDYNQQWNYGYDMYPFGYGGNMF